MAFSSLEPLMSQVTVERAERFKQVVAQRTRHITVVLEDIYQPHNASAVIRSCDCFGIQDVHIIENQNKYRINPQVALGSTNWVDIHQYAEKKNNSPKCLDALRAQGFTIVATSPHSDAYSPEDLPLEKPLAILLGTEKDGLQEETMSAADLHLKVPMYGFTESFNISVSAALILQRLRTRLEHSDLDFKLDRKEQEALLRKWLERHLDRKRSK